MLLTATLRRCSRLLLNWQRYQTWLAASLVFQLADRATGVSWRETGNLE
jgi:hypothetical protein